MTDDHDRILALEAEVKSLREDVKELASLGKAVNSLVDVNAKFIQDILRAMPKKD